MRDWFPWLILFLPLLSAVGITFFSLRHRAGAAALSIGASVLAFVMSIALFAGHAVGEPSLRWLELGLGKEGSVLVDIGLKLDTLSLLMLLVVTGVGSLIQIYSWGYMHDDPGQARFYAGLSLFTFAMLGIVLASNFLMMFVFWELVGVSSYILIGFWYDRPSAADAAKKAFLTNRIGDFGFLLGIVMVWGLLGSVNFGELQDKLKANPAALGGMATVAGLLIFCGAVGKSAQFPLHVWLPDAMEGPTPVSALIHAATMVAAGVYMLCRVFFLLAAQGSHALHVIAWVGAITALLAALMAVQQSDIKRILAYSTLSQLGYMVMTVGMSGASGNPAPAMYHLTTHAFFKALLFLGAGAVIHMLHHEQDIWRMGALSGKMRITFWTFLAGTLALCGVPPLSGFFSKDAILALAYEHSTPLFAVATFVAFLTAFYMGRLVVVAFLGPAKSQAPDHAHEAPSVMTAPLIALAIPSVIAGFWHLETLYGQQYGKAEEHSLSLAGQLIAPFAHAPVAAASGLVAALAGLGLAWVIYRRAVTDPLPKALGALARGMQHRFYFDEVYEWLIRNTQEALATAVDFVDRWVLAGFAVRGLHGTVELVGRFLRLQQTGNLQTYVLLTLIGLVILLALTLTH